MTGYIQLELGGKKRGIKFGNYALMEYSKLNGTGVAEFDETNPIKLCADLVYCGLKNNCFIKKEIEDFTQDDVLTWVDDMPMSQITDIIQVFEASAKQSQLVTDSNEAMAASTSKPNTEKPKK
jgi:hypothetical protein